jgi:putative PEP-CTERM system histidine kinase
MISAVLAFAFAATSLSYGGLATVLAVRAGRTPVMLGLCAASLATCLWALAEVLHLESIVPVWLTQLGAACSDGLWLVSALTILHRIGGVNWTWRALTVATVVAITIHAVLSVQAQGLGRVAGVMIDAELSGVLLTITGLIVFENLVRNVPSEELWSIKHFIIALGGLLGVQTLLRFPEFLTHKPEALLEASRPFAFLVVLPLFVVSAVRIPSLQLRIHTSRKFVFHTAAIVCMGVLLQGTALAAYYVRAFGGDNGTVLAVLAAFVGLVGTAVAAMSGSVRSRLRTFINENFFSYKYDYRVEWDRFNRSLGSNPEQKTADRVLRTLLELFDSSGGVLWARRESWRQFQPVAQFSIPGDLAPIGDTDVLLAPFATTEMACIELSDESSSDAILGWRERFRLGWLVVPLRYQNSLAGIALIAKPRAPKNLNWEDYNLVKLVASQLAVYLVQEEIAEALADARQLADFSKRSAFIIHDLKNAIGQLSLLVANTEKFGQTPEFQEDMVVTLRHSVEKLTQLLDSLRNAESGEPQQACDGAALVTLLSQLVAEKQRLGIRLVTGPMPSAGVRVSNPDTVKTVLEHIVSNAVEASAPGAPIEIRAHADEREISVTVEDKGAGMNPQFIAKELFRPLRSTKTGGLGIGAYQAREMIRSLGGDIHVQSRVGEGTVVSLSIPLTAPATTSPQA